MNTTIYFKLLVVSLVLSVFGLASCSSGQGSITDETETKVVCLGGVEYYQFREHIINTGYGFMAPKYLRDGSISLCEDES